MKRVMTFACVLCTELLMGGVVLGEEQTDVTKYEFTDETVVGGLPGIDEVRIAVIKRGKERSLIRVRGHFVNEMLKAVEDI